MSEEENKFGNFPKKWAKVLENNLADDDPFISKAQQSTYEDLQKMIANFMGNIVTFEQEYERDEDLKKMKEEVKRCSEYYTLGKKVNEAKKRYCVYIMESLGKPASESDE